MMQSKNGIRDAVLTGLNKRILVSRQDTCVKKYLSDVYRPVSVNYLSAERVLYVHPVVLNRIIAVYRFGKPTGNIDQIV